jgi:hypothetical protein
VERNSMKARVFAGARRPGSIAARANKELRK